KHTIEVTLAAPEYMNKTKGTFVVTVIKGIENLTVTVPSAEIYKESKKAATVKAEVAYNEGTEAPKTKKVIWEVVKPNGEAFAAGDALYGVLSMSNGKVTVNKSFVPTERTEDNQFCIKATAADYQGNTAFAMSEVITLMNKPIEISKICLVAPAEGGYQVVVKEGSEITTNVLENAFVVALKEDAPEKEIYTEEELSNYSISPALLTYKTSNKAVVVQEEEKVTLTSGKTAKNIVLTISTNDGGKKKATMKFSVVYAAPEALGLEVWDGDQRLGEALAKDISFAGTTNTRLTVKVKQKAGESWSDLNALVNYKLSVKNGKIISSDAVKGIYEIIVTAKKVTITLDNKTVNAKAKEIYQITNTAYSEAKAPKVKTASKLICGVMDNRSVVYQLSGYDYSNKAVMVETDFMDRNKKAEVYDQFETALLNENHPITISADGKLVLNFAGSNIPAGSYKLKLTFGTGENAESFVADAKPVTVTLKAVKPKVTKGSYSAPTSYKLDTKAGNSVKLIGKGKNVIENSVCYFDLKNSNVKGKQNNFLTYFELKDNILSLKEGVTEADIAYLKSKNGKNDLTAYVTYTVAYGDDGYGNPFTAEKTVKITVKLK
ncbi:MAG: hypothetical protein IKW28_10695, partial [Lachnospiraceae bacterium]|nr:hypothetical protein [Lachnospiraceae bacterium]